MKFKIHLLLFLIMVAIKSVTKAQTQVGTIPIDGQSLPIYIKQAEVDAIVAKLKGTTLPTIPSLEGQPDVVGGVGSSTTPAGATISASRYDLLKGFVINFKINNTLPSQISWDGTTYYPFSVIYQEPNQTGTYWLRSGAVTTKIQVKTGDASSLPYIIGGTAPAIIPSLEGQPDAVGGVGSTPAGDFNPTGTAPEMLPVGETYTVPIDRTMMQMSAFSFGHNGIQGMEAYLKQKGKLICYLKNNDGEVTNGGYPDNNHPMMTQIVIQGGELEVGYKNATTADYPIVHGLAQIRNNLGYTFYYAGGLNAAFYYKQLGKNEISVKKFNVDVSNDYGYITETQPGSLAKDFNVNFFKDGKLYLEEMLWNGDNEFKYNVPVKANSQETRCIRSKKDPNLEVCIQITTKSYGDTGTVKVLSQKGGLSISKDMVRISGYVFNYINYSKAEGIKDKDYKLYNNAGYVNETTKSIDQINN